MKKRLTALLVCVLLVFTGATLLCQVGDRFKQLDKNGDGVLTPDELNRPRLFARLDANSDGKITPEEAQKAAARLSRQTRGRADLPKPDESNVKYGPHERNVFDLWKAKSDKPTPLIVFIHGGGFVGGDKSHIPPSALKRALEAGASVMSINYRFLQHAPIQDILRDAARAIQFIRANAEKYNIDPKRIACFGSSAGAGTSLWLAVHPDLADPNSSDPVARQSTRISACACLNGQATYDLLEWQNVIYPFKPEWMKSPTEDLGFYHFKSRADYDTEEGRKVLDECSMLRLLSSDDPPIFMSCTLTGGDPKDRNHLLHHPKHVEVVKQKAESVGVKFEGHLAGDKTALKGDPAVAAVEFLLKHLGVNEK
ncbi:MAG: alpha/beta hydrolase fold domain-containing protein [Armatimonadota bacterium]|nr:alpha/beta hydrolase fold domain-containing protein [Armatimonadota bacterium]